MAPYYALGNAPCGASSLTPHNRRKERARTMGSCARRMRKENGG